MRRLLLYALEPFIVTVISYAVYMLTFQHHIQTILEWNIKKRY